MEFLTIKRECKADETLVCEKFIFNESTTPPIIPQFESFSEQLGPNLFGVTRKGRIHGRLSTDSRVAAQ